MSEVAGVAFCVTEGCVVMFSVVACCVEDVCVIECGVVVFCLVQCFLMLFKVAPVAVKRESLGLWMKSWGRETSIFLRYVLKLGVYNGVHRVVLSNFLF